MTVAAAPAAGIEVELQRRVPTSNVGERLDRFRGQRCPAEVRVHDHTRGVDGGYERGPRRLFESSRDPLGERRYRRCEALLVETGLYLRPKLIDDEARRLNDGGSPKSRLELRELLQGENTLDTGESPQLWFALRSSGGRVGFGSL